MTRVIDDSNAYMATFQRFGGTSSKVAVLFYPKTAGRFKHFQMMMMMILSKHADR